MIAARDRTENTKLDSEESIISLDVKNLHTNVPIKKAIDIAFKKLYNQNEPHDLSRSTMKRLLYMAVCDVQFNCNDTWHVQKDGLAMGASLAVILARNRPDNHWLKVQGIHLLCFCISSDRSQFGLLKKGTSRSCYSFKTTIK